MTREIDVQTLSGYLEELIRSGALEMQRSESDHGGADILIPYVMNDAVEYYFRLTDGKMLGTFQTDEDRQTTFQIVDNDGRTGIIFRQTGGNTVSIWYSQAIKEENNYQYHRIGHAWRTEKGEEHIRRLVNLLCVLHDKYTYLGEQACSEMELQLYPLIEFAPLCYWTPIDDSISHWYPETDAGITAMEGLAMQADDAAYAEMIRRYRSDMRKGKNPQKCIRSMAEEMLKPEHAAIFWLLQDMVTSASLAWKPRSYSEAEETEICKERLQAENEYHRNGYQGNYPYFTRGQEQVLLVEEHPFTVLESAEYQFRILAIDGLPPMCGRLWKDAGDF